jgi:hypothetical protein
MAGTLKVILGLAIATALMEANEQPTTSTSRASSTTTTTEATPPEPVVIQKTNGVVLFVNDGNIHTSTRMAHWLVNVNYVLLEEAFSQFKSQILKPEREERPFRDTMQVFRRYNGTKNILSSQSQEKEKEERQERDLISWVGGLFGLFNTYQLHEVKSKQRHQDEAIRATVQEVDALKDFAETNNDNIYKIRARIQKIESDTFGMLQATDKEIQQAICWEHIRRTMEAVTTVGEAALHHILSPQLDLIFNVEAKWAEFLRTLKNRGWEPAFSSYHLLFQRKVDFHFKNDILHLIVNIPVKEDGKDSYKKLRFRSKPFILGNKLTEIVTTEESLALQERTGAYFTITEQELNNCMKINSEFYCSDGYVAFTSPGQTCLDSVFRGLQQNVAENCPLRHRTTTRAAWTLSGNRFAIISEELSEMMVTCTGLEQRVIQIEGNRLVSIRRDCKISVPEFVLTPSCEDELNVVVEIGTGSELLTNIYVPDVQHLLKELNLTHPASVESVKIRVESELKAGSWSGPEIAAIVIAIVVLVIVAGIFGALYLKARFGAIPVPPPPPPPTAT